MHHEYDGIKELDNNLPPWWVWMFFATMIFAVVYLLNYHVFKTGDLQVTAYEKEIKRSEKEVKAYLSKMSMNVDETNATLMTDAADLAKGKAIFETNCVTCHNPKGEGNIGPNLTDKNWIYGYDIKEVFKTIKTGTPNGMPEHNSKFNPVQIQQVASFVISLPSAKGKDPQGEIIEK
jgi:cytochrome c oxidase cbb3-type subunit 3